MKISKKLMFVPLVATMLTACGDDDNNDIGNIVEVARDNGSFATLITALETTGLDDVLSDESRDFTVFAPTDAAFDKLDPAVLTALINDPEALSDILLYHVLPDAEVGSSSAIAAAGTTLTTANTDDVGVVLRGSDLFINSFEVIIPDVDASNGIIHAIDTVLLPTKDDPTSGTIAGVATAAGTFNTLLSLLTTDLVNALSDSDGKFTLFVPTDAAFAKINTSGLSDAEVEDILRYHVIVGKEINADAAIAIAGNTIQMDNSDNLALSLSGSDLFANLSQVSGPNQDASNGIIHIIDSVLLPPADVIAPTQDIVAIAQGNPDFSTLVTALLKFPDLVSALADPAAEFTVFAPTNAAFDALPAGLVADLLASCRP